MPADSSLPTDPSPQALTRSVRAGIAAFFGAPEEAHRAAPENRANYGRLIADLERRLLDSLRESNEPPPTLGPFVLEERIGRGGFAVVYRATHRRTGARAAVKVVQAGDDESRRRVASEVENLARLQHPNVVRVIDTGEDAGFAWIATEYIDGMTLADAIREMHPEPESFRVFDDPEPRDSPPPPPRRPSPDAVPRAVAWFRDLALALDALHATGVVHRDVKPANILIDRHQRPYLIDFGLSSSAETSVSGILAGTVPYMSPEQTLGGYVALTPRSDLYSLAATMHEVLTGDRVTHGVRREAILHQIAFVPVAPPSSSSKAIPASLDPIFARALAKDSNARYPSAKELAEDLESWLAQRPLRHVPESVKVRVSRVVRKHPVGTGLLCAAAIAVLVFLINRIVVRERHYRDVLASVRLELDAGHPGPALDVLGKNAAEYAGREPFDGYYREAVKAGGAAFVHEILSTQAFAVAGVSNEPHHAALARVAAFHIEKSGVTEPNLLLAVALSKHMSGRSAEARVLLEASPSVVEQSRPLLELSAIVAIADGDAARFEAAVRKLRAESPPEISTSEICLRAWRILYGRREPVFPAASTSPADLEQVEADVARILKDRSDYALARALLGLLKLARQDYRGARDEFDHLVKTQGGTGDRTGNLLMYSIAAMLAAGEATGVDERDAVATAIRYAKDAITTNPGLHERFLREITPASFNVRVLWILDALVGAWSRRPEFGPAFLTFTAATLAAPSANREPGVITKVAQAVDAEFGARLAGAMKTDYVAIRAIELWDLRSRLDTAARSGRLTEAATHARSAMQCVQDTRAKVGVVPYVMTAGEALAAAEQLAIETELPRKQALTEEATKLLRNATNADLLDAALKDAPNREAADQIRNLSQLCATQLQLIESADG